MKPEQKREVGDSWAVVKERLSLCLNFEKRREPYETKLACIAMCDFEMTGGLPVMEPLRRSSNAGMPAMLLGGRGTTGSQMKVSAICSRGGHVCGRIVE